MTVFPLVVQQPVQVALPWFIIFLSEWLVMWWEMGLHQHFGESVKK